MWEYVERLAAAPGVNRYIIVPAPEAHPVTLAFLYARSVVEVDGAVHTPDGTDHPVVVSASVISRNDEGAVNLWTTRPMTSLGY